MLPAVGQYELLDLLGRGQFGEVWRAKAPGGVEVAVKILNQPSDRDSAKRELKEETGLFANRWTMIQRTHLSNSVSDEEGFVFLAEDLTQLENELEETEADMKIWKLPFTDALNMVLEGKITDSLSVMGILKVARMRRI